MRLVQKPAGQPWQKYAGIYQGDKYMETGSMGNCVSVVAIAGSEVRGYHGSGGIEAVNFKEIKTLPDVPHSKLIVVFGDDSLDTIKGQVKAIIKEQGFRNWQWELYKSPTLLSFVMARFSTSIARPLFPGSGFSSPNSLTN